MDLLYAIHPTFRLSCILCLFVSLTSKLLIPPEHTRVDDDDGLFVKNSYQKRLL